MEPIVGMNASVVARKGKQRFEIPCEYPDAIMAAGGIPVLIPPLKHKADIAAAIARCTGLMFIGGDDYHPSHFGESPDPAITLIDPRRDAFDFQLARAALSAKKPLLGICNGLQLINVSLGGTLYQDIFTHQDFPDPLRHKQGSKRMVHWVEVEAGTRLAEITHTTMLHTNSSHHQSVRKLGRGLMVSGRSSDGCVEAIEGKKRDPFVLGVQWHPERIIDAGAHLNLFKAFIRACRDSAQPSGRRKRKRKS